MSTPVPAVPGVTLGVPPKRSARWSGESSGAAFGKTPNATREDAYAPQNLGENTRREQASHCARTPPTIYSVTRLRRLLALGRAPVTYFHDCRKLASGSRTQSRNAVA